MLKISDQAILEFKNIIGEIETPGSGIRVFLKEGGCCSGPSVGIDLTHEPAGTFTTHDFEGLKVFIEEAAFETVADATIDFFSDAENPGFRLQHAKKANHGGCGCS